jgi:hypothetical protein
MIGLLFGAATMVVMTIGAVVVADHLAGRQHIDGDLDAVAFPLPDR